MSYRHVSITLSRGGRLFPSFGLSLPIVFGLHKNEMRKDEFLRDGQQLRDNCNYTAAFGHGKNP